MSSRWPGKYVIGLTGNIATGKSVVRKMLEHLGAFGLDADALSHQAIAPGGPEPKAVTRAATAEDLPAILRLDEEVFGADRTPVITRLPAFADRLRVAEEDGRLIGYAAAWPNMETHVVGPLIARDTETAKALIASLAAHTDRPLRTDIDVRHEKLLAWAKERGLASVAFNAVMTYGIPELPGDWTRRFAPLTVASPKSERLKARFCPTQLSRETSRWMVMTDIALTRERWSRRCKNPGSMCFRPSIRSASR